MRSRESECSLDLVSRIRARDRDTGDEVDEKGLTRNTIYVARVIAKKYAPKCGKGAHEVGLEGDWSLNPRDIRSRHKAVGCHHGDPCRSLFVR